MKKEEVQLDTVTSERQLLPDRPPVIAIMGHVDHGKSKLLDYIRKTNVVEGEVGGITQHISAYEVEHNSKERGIKKITFLDTPGHEAFRSVRTHGAQVADIAVLVVAADEGVKTQTLEALETIQSAKLPYIVALSKIDKSGADVEKTKMALSEHGIYAEGFGGDIPVVPISSITGEGVEDLFEMILLVAEIEELKGDRRNDASGVVIEANVDRRKGILATLIIKEGVIKQGEFVVAGNAFAPVRIMEDFTGKKITEATFSMPINIVGFNKLPEVGALFEVVSSKKEAENLIRINESLKQKVDEIVSASSKEIVFPVILRADVSGSLEAIKHEFKKFQSDFVDVKIVDSGVGNISETDIKMISGKEHSTVIGFNTQAEGGVRDLAERMNVSIETFDIIYKLSEWVEEKIKSITPIQNIDELRGEARVLKCFSRAKNKQVIGGKVLSGTLSKNDPIKIMRKEEEICRGKILELQSQKTKTNSVYEDNEFGSMIEACEEIQGGDMLVAFETVEK
ncbi:MAG: translation initiation factor IF-2 [Candidatus Paceibacterota bacterium]